MIPGSALARFSRVAVEDNLVVVAARRALTAMWVDITQISFRCTRGVLYLGGTLQRMTVSNNQFHNAALREMDARLRKINDVRDVKYRFANWQRNIDGGWTNGEFATSVTIVIDEPEVPAV